MIVSKVLRMAALGAVAALAACHKDSTGPSKSSSALGNYYGVYGASNGSSSAGGSLVIVINVGSATGTLTPVGQAGVSLTGTYASGSGAVNLSGSGRTLVGTISGGKLGGTYTGPDGQGTFGTQQGATSSDVQLFCGTYSGASTGVWNLSKAGSTLTGAYADDGGGSAALAGSVSGSSISLTFSGGTASGSLTNATTMSGNWTAGAASGTWQGHSPC